MHRLAARLVLPLMLGVALGVALPAQDAGKAPRASRQEQVLALLQRIPTEHGQLHATPVARATNAYGCAVVRPDLHGLCGTGWQPAFDPELTRSLARELCAIYGLEVVADAPAPADVPARLDCLDRARGIGLKLRGTVVRKEIAGGSWPTVVDEPAATDLDVAEHQALGKAGVRVHVADVQSFWGAMSEDRLTTTLCYLASVAAFLNEVTDGEDVDCSALLPFDARLLPFDAPKAHADLRVEPWRGGFSLTAERATDVTLAVDPQRATSRVGDVLASAPANESRPVVVQVLGLQAERGAFALSLRQRGKDGAERELARSTTDVLFVPGTFDSTQPFALALALQPGQYRCDTTAWISAPVAPKR